MGSASRKLGKALAVSFGPGVDPLRVARQRAALLDWVDAERGVARTSRRPLGVRRIWLAALLLGGLATLLTLGLRLQLPAELVARARDGSGLWRASPSASLANGESIPRGSWLEAAGDGQVPIDFSEGSRLVLGGDSRARLVELDARQAAVELIAGKLHSQVTPQTGLRWTIAAGPYEVVVVGTVFDVDWSDERVLRVAVERGKVRVSGGALSEPVLVTAGMRLVANASDQRFHLAPASAETPAFGEAPFAAETPGAEPAGEAPPAAMTPPAAGATAAALDGEQATAGEAEGSSGRDRSRVALIAEPAQHRPEPPAAAAVAEAAASGAAPDSERARFRELLSQADHQRALAAAEQLGFSRVLAMVTRSELRQLGDAARLAGNSERAEQAYLALRRRFPGSSDAALAAYALARLALEAAHDDARGVAWLERYLNEAPQRGQLAAGARARLMNGLLRLGRGAEARRVAEDYLRYHPLGRHSDAARRLVQAPTP